MNSLSEIVIGKSCKLSKELRLVTRTVQVIFIYVLFLVLVDFVDTAEVGIYVLYNLSTLGKVGYSTALYGYVAVVFVVSATCYVIGHYVKLHIIYLRIFLHFTPENHSRQ